MSEGKGRSLRYYKRMMQQATRKEFDIPDDLGCEGCEFHRADWEYRYCFHLECPYEKGCQTFREKYFYGGDEDAGIQGRKEQGLYHDEQLSPP